MPRKLLSFLVPATLALFIVLSGCGGGGSKHTSTNSTAGTDGGTVQDGPGIVRDINSKPVTGAIVTFYSATGTSLGTTTIGTDGQAGTPPSGATSFSVNVASITSGGSRVYYDTYLYNGLHYDGSVANCHAPLTNGAFVSSMVFTPFATGQPPAAPDGCSG